TSLQDTTEGTMNANDVASEGLGLISRLADEARSVAMVAGYVALGAAVLVGRSLLDVAGEDFPFPFPARCKETRETRGRKRHRPAGRYPAAVRRTRPSMTRSERIAQRVEVRMRQARRSSATVSGAAASARVRATRSSAEGSGLVA